jgi:transposase-like protein
LRSNYIYTLYNLDGPGVIVEIDESKFGKRKYNRGHSVEGVWVVGGVERTPERRCFMMTVPNRNAETMENIITNHVLPDSVIHTDFWRAYNGIVEWNMGYQHHTVNHQEGYISADGTHTNTIEGNTIYKVKRFMCRVDTYVIYI